jgi:hypothetical protein
MSESAGTLQTFIIEIERGLKPLKDELSTAAGTKIFFARIGIVLTDAQAAAISGGAGGTITAIGDLTVRVIDIIAHIASESYAALTEDTIHAIEDIVTIIDGTTTIGNQMHGIHSSLSGEEIAQRIVNYLIFNYIESVRGVNEGLEFFGLLDRTEFNIDSTDPANPEYEIARYRFDRIGDWFSDPFETAKDIYDWGDDNFDGTKLFGRLEAILARLGLPVFYDEISSPKRLDLVVIEAVPKIDVTPHGLLIRLRNEISTSVITIPMGSNMKMELTAAIETPKHTGVYFLPDGTLGFQPPDSSTFGGRLQVKFILRKEPLEPFIIFGQAGGSRLEMKELIATSGTEVTWTGSAATGEFDFQAAINELKLIIDGTQGDGFLTKILPGTKIEAALDLLMGISTERGFYFSGSSALEIRLPLHIAIGPVALEGLTIAAKLQDGKIPVSLGADIKAELGPIVAVVQNMGIIATFSFPPDNSGNLGPLQLDIGFKPPNGVGLSIDAGVVKGGGFLYLDFDKGEYFGALELSFQGVISLKAIGIINTKMPDGSKGFALLILVTAEFTPIQLGFGFTLNGVGGLLAVNRSVDLDALRAGVRTGAVASILFPQDIVANITRIISDLKTIFPIVEGHFIIAPMGKIGWGTPTLITLEIGVILDIPKPAFVIIGILRCILPTQEAAILRLQVNFAGGIDFDAGLIWFDATIFDSSILVFTLSGDMALRIGWKTPVFVISVGGFHPAFTEIPADLTGMRRIMLALLSGDNPRLNAQIYFAITSNTLQSGARVELYASAAGFNLYGYLGYDLLIQFSPFHFIAQIYAGLALRRGTSVIAGVSVRCELSGPTPWNANGEASLKILFFKITVGFNETWGEDAPAQPIETVDVLQLIVEALQDDRNWKADIPANTSLTVTLKKIELPEDKIIIHPFGVLSASQKVSPLNLEINKFGNKKPINDTRFQINYAGSREEVKEEFAIANYVALSDSEKLARKSFERMPSGLTIKDSNASESGSRIQKEINYELSYVHRKKAIKFGLYKLFTNVFHVLVGGSAISKNEYSVSKQIANNAPATVAVADSGYSVVNVSNLEPHAAGLTAKTEAEAYMMYNDLVKNNPSLKGNIQVVSQFEL